MNVVSCTTEVSFSLQRINRNLRKGVLYSVGEKLSEGDADTNKNITGLRLGEELSEEKDS
jgi:hypothetical protein